MHTIGRMRPALAVFNGLQKLIGRLKPFGILSEQKVRLRPRCENNLFLATLSRTRLDHKIPRCCPQTFGIEHRQLPHAYRFINCMTGSQRARWNSRSSKSFCVDVSWAPHGNPPGEAEWATDTEASA